MDAVSDRFRLKPVTDTNFVKSLFFNLELAAGDKVSNIRIYDQVLPAI